MDILTRLQDAYAEGNKAKQLSLIPELIEGMNENKIIELPCGVGSDVYIIEKRKIKVKKCVGFEIYQSILGDVITSGAGDWDNRDFTLLESDKTGNYKQFYSRKEAEEALKNLQK